MPQTSTRFFDDLSRLMTDAAGLADGARREVETLLRTQLERLLAGMDVVQREEFEAAREMAALARAETDKLRERVAALEARLAPLEARLARLEETARKSPPS
ncbi:MAG TPA: accessory factor UbiK family protein [Roseiarcus sp.]|jgi:BMFP domain-containing protein YqiC|nr:accessory factor UbiK family protein [Roseiarcus sp.]